METTNDSHNSANKFYSLAKIPGQTVKNDTTQSSTNVPRLLDKNLPNNDLFSTNPDGKSNDFIDSKIYLFKKYLFKYGRNICPELDIVNNENNEIYDYPIVLLQDLYKELKTNFDSDYLYESIQTAYPKIMLVEKATEQIVLPLQIILGVMLSVYMDKVGRNNYVNSLKKIKNLSVATCYNYMKAARMIDIIDDERIFAIGLVPLYKLHSMYKKGKINNEMRLSKALIDMFCNITCSSVKLSDNDFVLAIKYVIFSYNLDQLNLDNKLLFEVFNGKYDWKKTDLTFIKSQAYKKDATNKIVLDDPDFANKYMKALINNDFNGRLARESFKIPLPAIGSKTIIQPVLQPNVDNPFTIKSSVSHLLETLDYHTKNSTQFSNDELIELKLIRDKLNQMNL